MRGFIGERVYIDVDWRESPPVSEPFSTVGIWPHSSDSR